MEYLEQHWRSIIFVVAVVTLVNHEFPLFQALDGYTFVALGNVAARSGREKLNGESVGTLTNEAIAVVLIDQDRHESIYLEQSPLNRCALKEDLESIYLAHPKLVAIDLDISPAIWLRREPDNDAYVKRMQDCQRKLYELLKRMAVPDLDQGRPAVKTVLMSPFPVSSAEAGTDIDTWRKNMERHGIAFGSANLQVNYGLILNNDHSPDAVARIVEKELGEEESETAQKGSRIDPRMYRKEFLAAMALSDLNKFASIDECKEARICDPSQRCFDDLAGRVVFFGGGWGEGDAYLTPIGEVYGVEVHAAQYLSLKKPIKLQNKLIAVGIDLLFASFFGLFFSLFWTRYFLGHLDAALLAQQLAGYFLLGLVLFVIGVLFISALFSYRLLLDYSVWASPIPITIGMLIDSFVWGAILNAMHLLNRNRLGYCALKADPHALWAWGLCQLSWGAIVFWALGTVIWD